MRYPQTNLNEVLGPPGNAERPPMCGMRRPGDILIVRRRYQRVTRESVDASCCCGCLNCSTVPTSITVTFGTWPGGGGWQGHSYTLNASGVCCYSTDAGLPCGCTLLTACIVRNDEPDVGIGTFVVEFTAYYPGGYEHLEFTVLIDPPSNDCKANAQAPYGPDVLGYNSTYRPPDCSWAALAAFVAYQTQVTMTAS